MMRFTLAPSSVKASYFTFAKTLFSSGMWVGTTASAMLEHDIIEDTGSGGAPHSKWRRQLSDALSYSRRSSRGYFADRVSVMLRGRAC